MTNPKPPIGPYDEDQIAIALKYTGENDTAPELVGKGRGAVAEQILQIAFAEGVRVREDADLAQVLEAVEIGHEIPLEAFAAVAEILAYVYRINGEPIPGLDDTPSDPVNTPEGENGP